MNFMGMQQDTTQQRLVVIEAHQGTTNEMRSEMPQQPDFAMPEMPQRPPDSQQEPAAKRPNYLPRGVMSVRGLVWKLAKDANGCRALQQAFEEASCDDDRMLLAS